MNPQMLNMMTSALRGGSGGRPGLMNGLSQGMQMGQQIRQGKANQQPAPVESRTGSPYDAPNIAGANPYGPPPGSMANRMGGNNLQAMIDEYYKKKAEAAAKPVAPQEIPRMNDIYG